MQAIWKRRCESSYSNSLIPTPIIGTIAARSNRMGSKNIEQRPVINGHAYDTHQSQYKVDTWHMIYCCDIMVIR